MSARSFGLAFLVSPANDRRDGACHDTDDGRDGDDAYDGASDERSRQWLLTWAGLDEPREGPSETALDEPNEYGSQYGGVDVATIGHNVPDETVDEKGARREKATGKVERFGEHRAEEIVTENNCRAAEDDRSDGERLGHGADASAEVFIRQRNVGGTLESPAGKMGCLPGGRGAA